MERICVAVRVRPPIKQEVVKGNYWRLEDNHISLHNALGTPISGYSYVFDHVFGYDSKNAIIYEVHTKDVIEAAVHGFNGTVFAYGQTSSGKTYTMQGSSEDPGIIRLAVYNIFQNIQLITDREFLIRVSYMEIYNEEINDLLAPENQKLQVHENLERGIFVAGLREEIVNSPEQVFELVERGEVHRHVGQTNMNVHSSRSHTIFRMVIESRDKDAEMSGSSYNKDAVRVSVLNLVDLAGSERVAKTGAGGVRLKEGTHINKSLMSLGTVINKLSDGGGKQRGHIPYRDSKLTRILQPALGGNAKTAIICTIAPEEVHTDETRGTLQFASRAKRVTNCAQVNEIVTDAALLKRQKREIEELRKKLQGSHSEVLEQEILKLRNDMLKFELEREKLAMELEEERKAQLERDRRIMEQQLKIDNLSTLVINSDQDRNSFKINSCERTYPRRLSLEFSDQDRRSTGNGRESSFDSRITLRKEKFLNPSFEALFDGSAEKQRSGSRRLDGSPLPPNFGNIADEDMWMSLNKGHETSDLEFLQSTPNGNFSSVRSSDISSVHGAVEGYREEIENLKVQLRKAVQDKQELEKCLEDQLMLNGELKMAIFKFEREAALIRRISENLGDAVLDCNEGRKGISTPLQELFAEEKSPNSMVLPFTDEANNTGLANLNGNLKKVLSVLEHYKQKNLELQRQCQMLNEQVKDAKGRHTDNHCSIECQLSQIKNLDEEQEPGSDFDGRKVRKCFGLNANSLWLADNNSEMVSVPISQNFKRICQKVWQLENVLDVVPAIDFDALCSQIEDEFSSILSERSSVSESLTDFIIAISCKHSDKIEVGNLETDKTHRMHNEESDFVCNILDDDSSAFRTKTSCDKVTSTRNLRIVTLELANGVFLAKWLAEELKNLTSHDIGLLFSSVKMNPEIGKLIKGLQICVNEIIKFSSGLQQLSCEKDYPRRNLNLQLKTHEKSREAAVENSPSGIYVDCTINELQQRLAVPAAVQMQFHGGEDLIKNQLPVDASSNSVSLRRDCNFKQEDRLVLLERLCMSAEHILSLDNKLALLNIEKDAISKALDNELHMHEQKQLDARFRELLAEEIRQFTTALAGRDGIYASIRCGIMEFEKNVEKKRAQNFISQATCLEALLPPAQV